MNETPIYDATIFVCGSIVGMIAGFGLQFAANRRGLRGLLERRWFSGYNDGFDKGFIACASAHEWEGNE